MKALIVYCSLLLLLTLHNTIFAQIIDPFNPQAVAASSTVKQSDFDIFLAEADNFFKQYIQNGSADYQRIKENGSYLKRLVKLIGAIDLTKLNGVQKEVLFINAYNILVIEGIVENYPVSSVLKISGFFDKRKHLVGGKNVTLDELEKKELFGLENNSLFHFVLACSAKGCPPLADFAYTPQHLTLQLEERTRLALDNKDFLYINDEEQKIYISQIFEWYNNDFKPYVGEFINTHRSERLPFDYQIRYYPYDWDLNDFHRTEHLPIMPISFSEIRREIEKGTRTFVLDARSDVEYNISHVKNAHRAGLEDFSMERVWMIDRKALVAVYSNSDENSNSICDKLKEMGFENVRTLGNILAFRNEGQPLVDAEDKQTEVLHVGSKENLKKLKVGKGVSFE